MRHTLHSVAVWIQPPVELRADDIRSCLTKLGQRDERKDEDVCELKEKTKVSSR